jgi:hypothetical protein
MAAAGAAWAAFLLPPQLVAWDGGNAPNWAQRFAYAAPYDGIRSLAADVGIGDEYALFGSLVAPSFLLIGTALLLSLGATSRWTRLTAILTILGMPISVLSYIGHDADAPWRYFWGAEIPLLLAIGLCAVPAGIMAYRHRNLRGWRAALLASTTLVLIGSTALFTYFPHGSLVGYGVEVALLAMRPPGAHLHLAS